MRREDAIRIRHMIDAATLSQRFIAGRVRSDLDGEDMLLFALVCAVEVIGEAASRGYARDTVCFAHSTMDSDRRDAQPAHSRVFRH
ncbi:MAG: hypothetical protein ACLP7P_08395 [Rhodomicrobium sp.]